jgi:uncharacterized membrane protein
LKTATLLQIGDGLFHLGTYVFTVVGLVLLWRALHQQHRQVTATALVGGLLLGWGLFNLIEGLVDHHILQVHHVRPGPNQLLWDIGFLLWGAVMAVVSAMLMYRRANTQQRKLSLLLQGCEDRGFKHRQSGWSA